MQLWEEFFLSEIILYFLKPFRKLKKLPTKRHSYNRVCFANVDIEPVVWMKGYLFRTIDVLDNVPFFSFPLLSIQNELFSSHRCNIKCDNKGVLQIKKRETMMNRFLCFFFFYFFVFGMCAFWVLQEYNLTYAWKAHIHIISYCWFIQINFLLLLCV